MAYKTLFKLKGRMRTPPYKRPPLFHPESYFFRVKWFPRVHSSYIPVGGGALVGGASTRSIALHFTGSGGVKDGGAATMTSFLLLGHLLYREVQSTNPSVNPTEVDSDVWEVYP